MGCREAVNDYVNTLSKSGEGEWAREVTHQERIRIPDTGQIPLEIPHWLKIRKVTAVYADMVGSTYVALRKHQRFSTTARIYEIFSGTLARVMNDFGVAYMDIQGDGILGLWDDKNGRYLAFCAAVTFKTFAERWFKDWVKKKTDGQVEPDVHIGMDEYEVYVKRIGMRGDWRQKEVWAGQPVNIAVKLCDLAEGGQIIASDRLYEALEMNEIRLSCGCSVDGAPGEKLPLWEEMEVDPERFLFSRAWRLRSNWCKFHGSEYCRIICSQASDYHGAS